MMTKVIVPIAIVCAALALLIAAAGCHSSKPEVAASLTPQQVAGQQIFNQTCAVCHRNGEHGPNLVGIYKKRYMSNGMPVNDDRVRDTIRMGRAMMPAFSDVLNQQQLEDVIAYLHVI
jgi:mono/diheme cytochrome c family protein